MVQYLHIRILKFPLMECFVRPWLEILESHKNPDKMEFDYELGGHSPDYFYDFLSEKMDEKGLKIHICISEAQIQSANWAVPNACSVFPKPTG